jgi:hypothetical protein
MNTPRTNQSCPGGIIQFGEVLDKKWLENCLDREYLQSRDWPQQRNQLLLVRLSQIPYRQLKRPGMQPQVRENAAPIRSQKGTERSLTES